MSLQVNQEHTLIHGGNLVANTVKPEREILDQSLQTGFLCSRNISRCGTSQCILL